MNVSETLHEHTFWQIWRNVHDDSTWDNPTFKLYQAHRLSCMYIVRHKHAYLRYQRRKKCESLSFSLPMIGGWLTSVDYFSWYVWVSSTSPSHGGFELGGVSFQSSTQSGGLRAWRRQWRLRAYDIQGNLVSPSDNGIEENTQYRSLSLERWFVWGLVLSTKPKAHGNTLELTHHLTSLDTAR
jgi:hypothetical protein